TLKPIKKMRLFIIIKGGERGAIFALLLLFMVFSCSSPKPILTEGATTRIDYKVLESKKLADSVWAKVKAQVPGVSRDSKMALFHKKEETQPSFYQLLIKNQESRTKYIEALVREDGSRLKVTSQPFSSNN